MKLDLTSYESINRRLAIAATLQGIAAPPPRGVRDLLMALLNQAPNGYTYRQQKVWGGLVDKLEAIKPGRGRSLELDVEECILLGDIIMPRQDGGREFQLHPSLTCPEALDTQDRILGARDAYLDRAEMIDPPASDAYRAAYGAAREAMKKAN